MSAGARGLVASRAKHALGAVKHVLAAWWFPLAALGLALLAIVAGTARARGLDWPWGGHRRTPSPRGSVFQLVTREAGSAFDCLRVRPIDRDGPAVAVIDPWAHRTGAWSSVPSVAIYRYPSGELLARVDGEAAARLVDELDARSDAAAEHFDFDGDGAQDRIEIDGDRVYGRVRVLSGRNRRVLFEDDDPLEYECDTRAFALGDLDGDGFGELALVHLRSDRSTYDFELWDRLLGAKSWISIVSGSRIAR